MSKETKPLSYNFKAKEVTQAIIQGIRDWFDANGQGCNALVGVSSGKDSSIVCALCVAALGKDRVIGIQMPNGHQYDIGLGDELIEYLGIRSYKHNIKPMFDAAIQDMRNNGVEPSEQTIINLPPRLRMSVLYQYSQSLKGRVMNTSNLSEDWVSNFTRWGDQCGDYCPLLFLTVDEVKKVGYEVGLPAKFIEKVPEDGLVGKTDEDNIGVKYAVLDRYIRTGEIESEADKELIDRKYITSQFKRDPIAAYHPYIGLLYEGMAVNPNTLQPVDFPPCFHDPRWHQL